MSKTFISYVFDGVSTAFMGFLTAYAVSFFYLKARLAAAVIGVSISVATVCVYIIIARKKRSKILIKKSDENGLVSCRRTLCLKETSAALSLIVSALKKTENQIVEKNEKSYLNGKLVCCRFSVEPLSADEILQVYKSERCQLIFFGNEFTESAKHITDYIGKDITLVDMPSVYKLLKNAELLPETETKTVNRKEKIKSLFVATFQRKKAGSFALYGSVLLIMSRFVFYPLWYIISGTIFLLYAITVKFFAAKDEKYSLW